MKAYRVKKTVLVHDSPPHPVYVYVYVFVYAYVLHIHIYIIHIYFCFLYIYIYGKRKGQTFVCLLQTEDGSLFSLVGKR